MKCLITGIGGFVGPYLKEFLLEKGLQVYGIEMNACEDESVFECDILDQKNLTEIIKEIKPDYVFHLAGQSSVRKSWEIPEKTKEINVQGTRNLLEAVKTAEINPKILIVSSSEVYGPPQENPVTEDHPLNPQNPYAESRVAQEELCRNYPKLQIVISRSFNHIGPGQSPVFVCSDFAKQIAEIEKGEREAVIKVGNLSARRDFTDVRDIVEAYFIALEKGKIGETYNLCSGQAYAIQEILDILRAMAKVKVKVEEDPEKIRPVDVPTIQGSYSLFQQQTGWKPKIEIKETLKNILDYWREK